MKCKALFDVIDSINEYYIKVWEDVCNIESPTDCKDGVDRVGDYFINLARERGMEVEICRQPRSGDAVCIALNPCAKGEAVCLSGHIDTVHPIGLFPSPAVRFEEDKIYGPGVSDCKGGVVAGFMALDALRQVGFDKRPVRLIIQTDEEVSSRFSNKETIKFMCEKSRGAVAFLNAEGAVRGRCVLETKGIYRCLFKVRGASVHSAVCNTGSNAICEAAYKIIELEKLKNTDEITCNCGVISGGSVANTVAEECEFTADFRFNNERELEKIKEIVRDVAQTNTVDGCSCIVEEISSRPAMEPSDKNQKLLNTINDIYEQNGFERVEAFKMLGGTDAAYITAFGVPCIDGIGVLGAAEHSIDEWAYVDSLADSAKRQAAIAFCI